MSVNDQLHLTRRDGYGWLLLRGHETFYDDERYIRTWPTKEAAEDWAEQHLGETPVIAPGKVVQGAF